MDDFTYLSIYTSRLITKQKKITRYMHLTSSERSLARDMCTSVVLFFVITREKNSHKLSDICLSWTSFCEAHWRVKRRIHWSLDYTVPRIHHLLVICMGHLIELECSLMCVSYHYFQLNHASWSRLVLMRLPSDDQTCRRSSYHTLSRVGNGPAQKPIIWNWTKPAQ